MVVTTFWCHFTLQESSTCPTCPGCISSSSSRLVDFSCEILCHLSMYNHKVYSVRQEHIPKPFCCKFEMVDHLTIPLQLGKLSFWWYMLILLYVIPKVICFQGIPSYSMVTSLPCCLACSLTHTDVGQEFCAL